MFCDKSADQRADGIFRGRYAEQQLSWPGISLLHPAAQTLCGLCVTMLERFQERDAGQKKWWHSHAPMQSEARGHRDLPQSQDYAQDGQRCENDGQQYALALTTETPG